MIDSKRVEVLDYLRGAAIFSVLMVHCLATAYGGVLLPWHGWFRNFSVHPAFLVMFPFSFGKEGVAIFFIVSGFCIHTSFQQKKNWKHFFINRFFRIYPPYFFTVILFALCLPGWPGHLTFHHSEDWFQLFTHLLLIHNFSQQYLLGINGAFWSLAIEVQLYLIYPVLLWMVSRLNWRKTMLILAAIEIFLRASICIANTGGQSDSTWARILWPIEMSPLGYWCSWSLGARIADAHIRHQPLPFLKQSLVFWAIFTLIGYLVKPLESFRFLLVAVTVAIMTSKLLNGWRPGFPIPAWTKNMFKQLGAWSYGLYLVHQPIIYILFFPIIGWIYLFSPSFSDYLSEPPFTNQCGIFFRFFVTLASLLIVVPIGALWFRMLERPGISLGNKFKERLMAKKTN